MATPLHCLVSTETNLVPPVDPKELRLSNDYSSVVDSLKVCISRKPAALPNDLVDSRHDNLHAGHAARKFLSLWNRQVEPFQELSNELLFAHEIDHRCLPNDTGVHLRGEAPSGATPGWAAPLTFKGPA